MEIRCDVKKMFDHEKVYCHMIHGLVCSTERLLCCLVEVHQTPEVWECGAPCGTERFHWALDCLFSKLDRSRAGDGRGLCGMARMLLARCSR
jgi:hypothetical protein